MTSELIWRQLHWPRPLDVAGPTAVLRAWAADEQSPPIVLEARAEAGTVRYLLGCARSVSATVERRLITVLPKVRLTDLTALRTPISMAARLQLTTRHRPLRVEATEITLRQVLGALSQIGQDELLVLQLIIGPRRVPLAIPNQSPSSIVMPWYQVAWQGNGGVVDGEKRSALRAKVGDHGFAASVRLGALAVDGARRRRLIRQLFTALRVSETPGLRATLAPESSRHLNTAHLPWRWPLRLNAAEAVALTGWPIGEDELPGLLPLHPQQIAPTALALSGTRVVGTALAPGVDGQLGYDVDDALRHTHILGPNGTGKSTLLLNLIDQDLRAGRPVVVIEPKDLITDLLSRIPDERREDVVLLDPLDSAPVGINPLIRHGRRPEVVADGLFSLFQSLHGDNLGPRSSDVLINCLNALTEREDASLVMLPLLLTNPGFRRSLTQAVIRRDPIAAGPFWQWFDDLSVDARSQVIAPLQNKLRPLLRPTLRTVLGQRRPRFNIRQVLLERKVLLVPLQKGALGPATTELLGALVLNELWLAIRERVTLPAAHRVPVQIYLDEVQDFLRLPTDLSDALATSRSLGAAWHLAHQFRDQLPVEMRSAVEANARSRICFQLNASDARAMAAGQTVLTPEDFSLLPGFHIYASLMRRNSLQPWASATTVAAPKPCSDPDEIRAASRRRYGQPLDVIEADFAALLEPTLATDTATGRRTRSRS